MVKIIRFLSLALGLGAFSQAAIVPITFTELTGTTGGSPAETAVYKADLTGVLTSLLSISISDNSGALGGSPGQFSGFDLDAIKLSPTDCATAACAAAAPGLSVFDFLAGTQFLPGTQRPPVDAKLFGTGAGGNTVDNAMATLGSFDGNSTTGPTAFGFISMGDTGKILFNLSSAIDPTGVFLYIGEVGNNGEVAAGSIQVSDGPQTLTPEPGTSVLLGGALIVCSLLRRRAQQSK